MKSLVLMLVMVIFLSNMAYRAESLSNFSGFNFPDSLSKFLDSQFNFPGFNVNSSVLDNLIIFADTTNKNNKIGKDEIRELLGWDLKSNSTFAALWESSEVIEYLDQDGDREVSKDEFLRMAKEIIDNNYINIFDLDNDGALSEDEFMGRTFDVDGAIKVAPFFSEILFNILGDVFNEIFPFENIVGSTLDTTLDKMNDDNIPFPILSSWMIRFIFNNITKEEVCELASTAIKVSDINKDGKITEKELFRTLEQNNMTKKTVDYFRQYSQNQNKTKAWKELFQKLFHKKLYADEIVQLLNTNISELIPIGHGLIPVYMRIANQEFPTNADEWYAGVESFLENKVFKQIPSSSAITSSSAIAKVNVILVLTLASTFGASM